MGAVDESQMEPESPRVGSPVKPTSPEKDTPAPAKKQLSSAQKASLARAREKARQSNEEDGNNARQRVTDHAALAKQVYENNVARYKSDVVYKSSFPYLQGA